MKNLKTQKGITLIALIITIIVLLILAAVTISTIQNNGILGHAQSATSDYKQSQTNETIILNKYQNFLDNRINKDGVEEDNTNEEDDNDSDTTGDMENIDPDGWTQS